MPKSTIGLVPDSSNNTISFNGKSVVMNMTESVISVMNISAITEDIDYGDNNPDDMDRYFRYSRDGKIWSMWYPWTPFADDVINRISVLRFNPDDELYFSFKYEYFTSMSPETGELPTPVVVKSIGIVIYIKRHKRPSFQPLLPLPLSILPAS